MFAVAGRRVVRSAINVAVTYGHAFGGSVAEDDMLAADVRGCDVVYPHLVGVCEGYGVATPDVLGIEVGDLDILNNDIGGSATNW